MYYYVLYSTIIYHHTPTGFLHSCYRWRSQTRSPRAVDLPVNWMSLPLVEEEVCINREDGPHIWPKMHPVISSPCLKRMCLLRNTPPPPGQLETLGARSGSQIRAVAVSVCCRTRRSQISPGLSLKCSSSLFGAVEMNRRPMVRWVGMDP